MIPIQLSIIIPFYNVAPYIERCVRSVLDNIQQDWEVILVNDKTPDNTQEVWESVLATYPNEVRSQCRIVKHETNKGIHLSRHDGFQMAKGEYVAFLDSDDWVEPQMYGTLLSVAKEKNADVVYCDFCFRYGNNARSSKSNMPLVKDDKVEYMKSYLAYSWQRVTHSIMRKSLIDGYDWSIMKGRMYEDAHMSTCLYYKANNIVKVDAALCNYYMENENSLLHTQSEKSYEDECHANLALIDFFTKQGVIEQLEEVMSWRILKAKQEYALRTDMFNKFLNIYPVSRKYIMTCPFIGKKIKCIMWLLTHNMRWAAAAIVNVRTTFRGR